MNAEAARLKKGDDGIFDFEELVVEPRMVRVAGEVADVSIMPLAVTMAVAKMADRTKEEVIAAAEEGNGETEIARVAEMLSQVCMPSNPKFTAEFLMKNLTGAKFRAFARFVLQPYQDDDSPAPEAETGEQNPGE